MDETRTLHRKLAAAREMADVLRASLAEKADVIADQAEHTATMLEKAAARGDRERRLRFAAWEREVARIERLNADALRDGAHPGSLHHLPPWPD
jgi:hypothetical protein